MARAATRALLGAAGRVHLICAQMGGGNGQKSAMARQRNQAKLDAEGQGGGGAEGKEQRGGDTGAKIAKSQAEKVSVHGQLSHSPTAKLSSATWRT